MFCTNCGEKLEEQAVFCTGCGQKVDRAAAAAPTPSGSTAMFESPAPPPEPPRTEPPKTEAPQAFPTPVRQSPPPGAGPMHAAPSPVRAAKPGNSKLILWMGMLVVLLAIVGGLAYVAFRQFVKGSAQTAADVQQAIADAGVDPASILGAEEPETAIPEDLIQPTEDVVPEEIAPAPAPEPVAPPPPARVETPPAQTAPVSPPPKAAQPVISTPKPTPAKAPEPVAAPAPPPKTATAPAVSEPAPAKTEPPPPPPAPKGSKVMLSGPEAYSPPAAPKTAAAPAAVVPKAPPAPSSGDVFWSGTLKKNQTVTVDFADGSTVIGGQPLPGKPVRLETFSPVVEIVELPGPENGWKRFSFRATRDAKKSVTLNFHWSLTQ